MVAITHGFTSAIADDPAASAAGKVLPSHWNAGHTILMTDTQRVVGRNTAGSGAAEEVTLTQLLDWIGSAAQGDILYRGASSWARLAAGTGGHFLKTNGAGANPQWSAPGNATITNAMLSNVATATFKGRTTAGTGAPEDLTSAQATALLAAVIGDSGAGGTKGLVPAPAAGDAAANKFLKASGAWASVATGVFTAAFTSSDQTITSAGGLTLAHSLGAVPELTAFSIVCQTAENGYSIGDVVVVPLAMSPSADRTFSVWLDSTNVNIRFGTAADVMLVPHKTTGVTNSLTNANWKLRVKAWA